MVAYLGPRRPKERHCLPSIPSGDFMNRETLVIALGAAFCALLGLLLYRFQAQTDNALMNGWGVVSFAAAGASLGCLIVKPGDDFLDWWF